MNKKTTLNELERAILRAAYWRGRYLDSNPDVGMGPWPEQILDSVLKEIQPGPFDKKLVLDELSYLRRYN